MAQAKYDGVLEAAHFKTDGKLEWVRVYERRYSVFTDRIMLSREAFIQQLKAGKHYVVGQRILNLGGQFNVTQPVHLISRDGKQIIVVGDTQAVRTVQDELSGVAIL